MTVTRVSACRVKYCPAPKDPDWHRCFVCQALEIEHHDAGGGGMGGGGGHHTKPENVVALCVLHHKAITIHEHSDRILDLPGRGRCYVYYDVRGNILCDRVLEAGRAQASKSDDVAPRYELLPEPSEPDTKSVEEDDVEGLEAGSAAAEESQAPSAKRSLHRLTTASAAAPSASGLPIATSRSQKRRLTTQGADFIDQSPASTESSVAEPLDRGAHPISAGDIGLVPTPSATPPSVFDKDTWCQEGMQLVYWHIALRDAGDEVRFRIGDWCNRGEGVLGEEVFGYLRGFQEVTVRQYSWVAGRVSPDTRVSELSWSHARAVAALPEPEQKEWLEKAQEENLSSKGLYRAIHGEKPRVKRWTLVELWALAKDFGGAEWAEVQLFLDYLEGK